MPINKGQYNSKKDFDEILFRISALQRHAYSKCQICQNGFPRWFDHEGSGLNTGILLKVSSLFGYAYKGSAIRLQKGFRRNLIQGLVPPHLCPKPPFCTCHNVFTKSWRTNQNPTFYLHIITKPPPHHHITTSPHHHITTSSHPHISRSLPKFQPALTIRTFILLSCITTIALLGSYSCQPDNPPVEFDPTPYPFTFGAFPTPDLPQDNLPTQQGVQLGRMLFYEKRLSNDNTLACASCHQQKDGFSDSRQFSIGTKGLPGRRQAMPLMNLAWHKFGFFWDGRSPTLRAQALRPIQDPLEMNANLDDVVAKLTDDNKYKDQFTRAFGDDHITSERIGLAIEQFELTLISNHAKYDDYLAGVTQLSAEEERGRQLFFTTADPDAGIKGAECFHCHQNFNFTINTYLNNGLDSEGRFTDLGRFEVTHNEEQRARFKLPSLRNVALTAPYMHDGRIKTLDEVIEHYNTKVIFSGTLDESMDHNLLPGGLELSDQDKADLKAFLLTLTDNAFVNDPGFASPF